MAIANDWSITNNRSNNKKLVGKQITNNHQRVAITNNRSEQTTGNPGLAGTTGINYGKSEGSGNRETII